MKHLAIAAIVIFSALAGSAEAKEPADPFRVAGCPPEFGQDKDHRCTPDPVDAEKDYRGVLKAQLSANEDEIALAYEDGAYPTVAQFLRPIWPRLVKTGKEEACPSATALYAAISADALDAAPAHENDARIKKETGLPETTAMLAKALKAQHDASDEVKNYFMRPRPYVTHRDGLPDVLPLRRLPAKFDNTSFPSGHASFGYATASVLAALLPERAATIMARADRYGDHRVILGAHFPSDVSAGRKIGIEATRPLLDDKALAPAKRELRAALCY